MEIQPQLLRRPDVERITGLKRLTLLRMVKRGDFPAPLKVGPQLRAWRVRDVQSWIDGLGEVSTP